MFLTFVYVEGFSHVDFISVFNLWSVPDLPSLVNMGIIIRLRLSLGILRFHGQTVQSGWFINLLELKKVLEGVKT